MMDDNRAAQMNVFPTAQIAKIAAAREKMTNEQRQAEIDGVHKKLRILPRKPPDVDEDPYETDTSKETDMTEHASAPTPKDTFQSGDENNNDKEKEDDNTLQPRTARKQGCENRKVESLLSDNSDDDHDDNDHDDNYSESSDDENKKKKRPRRTPKSTIQTPKKNHWSGNPLPAAQETATVLVAIGANPTSPSSWCPMDWMKSPRSNN